MYNVGSIIRALKFMTAKALGFDYVLNCSNNKIHKMSCRHVKSAKLTRFLKLDEVRSLINSGEAYICNNCKPLSK
jgi:hypothetical protein